MILKKWAFLALATVFACATFADAQNQKSRKTMKSKEPAKVVAPKAKTPPVDHNKAEPQLLPQTPPEELKPAAQPAEIERITVEELKEKIAKQEPVTIIDSRSQGSYDATPTKIKGAIRISADDVQSHLKDIPRDKTIVIYCT